jgi:putative heme-binding domain-containing protein
LIIRRFHSTICLLFISFFLLTPNPLWSQDLRTIAGKKLYMIHCSRCHGVTGGGGEGPVLARSYLPRANDDEAFSAIIQYGIEGTAMPGNWALGDREINEIIHYVRGLGEVRNEVVKGDASRGEILFLNSGCLSCHAMGENGKSVGPTLSGIGLRRGSNYLRETLTSPGKEKIEDENGFIRFLVVDVLLHNGKTISGVRVNEDTFTIQLKDVDNRFYSIQKNDVKAIQRRREASLMPSFEEKLTMEEIDDLVAFLTNQK